jgi:Zn finger protein HypA/HybF involved in hydrogenase expression
VAWSYNSNGRVLSWNLKLSWTLRLMMTDKGERCMCAGCEATEAPPEQPSGERCPRCDLLWSGHLEKPGGISLCADGSPAPKQPSGAADIVGALADRNAQHRREGAIGPKQPSGERCKYCGTGQLEPDTGICHRCYDTERDAIIKAVEEERAKQQIEWDEFIKRLKGSIPGAFPPEEPTDTQAWEAVCPECGFDTTKVPPHDLDGCSHHD